MDYLQQDNVSKIHTKLKGLDMCLKRCFGTYYTIWKNILAEITFQYLIVEMSRELSLKLYNYSLRFVDATEVEID